MFRLFPLSVTSPASAALGGTVERTITIALGKFEACEEETNRHLNGGQAGGGDHKC